MDYIKLAKEKEDKIIQIRRDLHRIPELQLELPETMNYITKILEEYKIPYKKIMNGNAIIATIKGQQESPCIAIRADSDALPIKEETGLEFASTNENMHACGHDGHTAMALGAAIILWEHRELLKGSVKIFFQPGEEYPGGAKPMIEQGCMENPKVDAIIGLHEGYLFPMESGKIGIKSGPLMASMDRFRIYVKGKGAHGAQPHTSFDPIPVAAEIISSLQKIVSREIDPLESAVLSICQIHGGTSQNIIPDTVFLEGTVRALNEDVRKHIANRIEEMCTDIAKANRCEADVIYDFKYPVLVNDEKFTEFFKGIIQEEFGPDTICEIEKPTMGGEDMAYFLQKAPGTFFALSNPKIHEGGQIYSHHNSKFDVDESQFYKGTAAFIMTVFKYLS